MLGELAPDPVAAVVAQAIAGSHPALPSQPRPVWEFRYWFNSIILQLIDYQLDTKDGQSLNFQHLLLVYLMNIPTEDINQPIILHGLF